VPWSVSWWLVVVLSEMELYTEEQGQTAPLLWRGNPGAVNPAKVGVSDNEVCWSF